MCVEHSTIGEAKCRPFIFIVAEERKIRADMMRVKTRRANNNT